jgi:hypothetical protein
MLKTSVYIGDRSSNSSWMACTALTSKHVGCFFQVKNVKYWAEEHTFLHYTPQIKPSDGIKSGEFRGMEGSLLP